MLATAVSEWTRRPKVATQFLRTLTRCDHPELGKLVRTILMVMQESQVQVPWVKDIESVFIVLGMFWSLANVKSSITNCMNFINCVH